MDFVTVHHPDLPGQSARMRRPRNGWVPDEATVHLPPNPVPDPGKEDKPAAGESKSKKPKE